MSFLATGRKQVAVRAKVLPLALYGCESTPATQGDYKTLAAATKRCLAVGNAASGSALLLSLTWGKQSHDPHWHVLKARATQLRK
eukprot:6656633-Alexandrium_andersonii.AAC.1